MNMHTSSQDTIYVGLDIGTTKIVVMVGRRNEYGKLEILGMGKTESVGVSRGQVVNIDKTVQSIKTALEEAEAKTGYKITRVNVGIAGQHIKSIQHHGIKTRSLADTEISQADIDALIEDMYKLAMLPGEEIIHVIPQEYMVDSDSGIREPIGMCGRRLEANFHIITGAIGAINHLIKCVKKAGLEVAELTLEPLASADAVLSQDEKEAGVVLVDIGGGTTDIAIFQDSIIRHTAVIPFGGNIITEDIKEGCTIIKSQAELLKMKFGSALSRENSDNEIVSIPGLRGREPKEISLKNLAYIIEARMEEIIEHVFYEIRSSGFEKKIIAGIVITGGGAMLKHVPQLFEYVTGMDTRIGFPNEHLAKGAEDVTSPVYSTGVGLVLRAMRANESEKSVSLKQEDVSAEETKEPEKPPISDHSKKTKGNFFERLMERATQFLNEDN
ncbi:MAG: cell division protein FtsA [Bacteroidota bacterium]